MSTLIPLAIGMAIAVIVYEAKAHIRKTIEQDEAKHKVSTYYPPVEVVAIFQKPNGEEYPATKRIG